MFSRNISIVILLIVIVGISTAIYDENYNSTTKTVVNPNDSKSELKEQVQIIYDGKWNGSISQGYSSNNVKGTGNIVYGVSGKVVSAIFQKQDDNNSTLTVNFLKNGKIVATASTSGSYGAVQTAYTFK